VLRLPTEEERRQAGESLRELAGAKGPIRVVVLLNLSGSAPVSNISDIAFTRARLYPSG